MRRALLVLLLVLAVLTAACATASFDIDVEPTGTPIPEPSPTGDDPYGTSIDGPFLLSSGELAINTCHRLGVTAGSSLTFTDTTGFLAGHLLLVTQVRSTTSSAGQFELVRIASVAVNSNIVATGPLLHSYASAGGVPRAQACTVPEFSTVTLDADARLVAPKWDGTDGGVLAFLASSSLVMAAGAGLDADAAGFRGGVCNLNPAGDNGPADSASGGEKGERVSGDSGNGRSHASNGGGGGNPKLAGGGGGGAGNVGGEGGPSPSNANTFGEGGEKLTATGARLYFGGGGGGGHGVTDGEIANCDAGDGGGVVFFQVRGASGAGRLSANGGAPGAAGGLFEASAGGGGGAGGMVWAVVATDGGFEPVVSVEGGGGGDGASTGIALASGGGGGAGGWTRLQGFAADSVSRDGGGGGAGTNAGSTGGTGEEF